MTIPNGAKINQTYIVGVTDIMQTYDLWVVIDGRDTHITIQAKDSLQARSIGEQLYGRVYGCTLLS